MGALLRTLGGLAVLFSVVGYLIIMTFIKSMGLAEMFWITNQFYISASATFLLDMVLACLSLPTIILGAVLYKSVTWAGAGIFPGQSNENFKPYRRLGSYAVVALILAGAGLYSYYFDGIRDFSIFDSYISRNLMKLAIFAPGGYNFNVRFETAAVYFSIIVPFFFAIGVFIYKNISKKREIRRWALGTIILASTIFMSAVYGYHIYDWQMLPIRPSEKSNYTWPEDDERAWLLNHSLGKYIIVRQKEVRQEESAGMEISPYMSTIARHLTIDVVDSREAFQLELDPLRRAFFKAQFDFPAIKLKSAKALKKTTDIDIIKFAE